MVRRTGLVVAGAVVVIAIALAVLVIAEHNRVGYVVCSDKRIYELDLTAGRILRVSAPIAGMGGAGERDIAYGAGILYVGSQRGKEDDFHPLLAIDVARDFEVVGVHRFGAELGRPYRGSGRIGNIYSIALSPSGNRLFVMGQPYEGPAYTPEWPTGKGLARVVVHGAENAISHKHEFSPDGNSIASIWPARQRMIEDGGGNAALITWHVSTRDVAGGEWSTKELVGKQGLHPPWARLEGPLVYVARNYTTNTNRIELYDRDRRERLAEIDVNEVTGLWGGYRPEMLEGTNLLAIPAADPSEPIGHRVQGYVLVLDVVTREVVSKIRVGRSPTNLALVKRAGSVRRMVFGG